MNSVVCETQDDNRDSKLRWEDRNHKTALQYQEDVDAFEGSPRYVPHILGAGKAHKFSSTSAMLYISSCVTTALTPTTVTILHAWAPLAFAERSYAHLHELPEHLGLDVSSKKSHNQSKCIQAMSQEWSSKHFCSRQQSQCLLGNLLHIHECTKPAHIFVNCMLDLQWHSITLTPDSIQWSILL